MHRGLLMTQESLNEFIGQKLDMDFEKHFYSKYIWIVFGVVFLVFSGLDLIFFLQGEKLGYSLSLLSLGMIIFLFIPIMYLSKLAEPKNPLSWLTLNNDSFIFEYRNGFQKEINVTDIEKVFIDIAYGKHSVAFATIYTHNEKTIIQTSMFKNFFRFLAYLKDKNLDIQYSNKFVEYDVNDMLKNPKEARLKGFLIGFLIVFLYVFLCAWFSKH